MTSLSIEPMFESFAIAIVAAVAVLAVLWIVTPPTVSPRQRWILFSLRLLAGLVLLLAAFRPTLVRSDRRPADASLIIAVDSSRSMTLSDGRGGDRWSQQQKAFADLVTRLTSFDEALAVKVIAYDSKTRVVELLPTGSLAEIAPDGELTDLEAAATASIEAAGGQPIAGIVMTGDGTQTATVQGSGPLGVAQTLNSLGIPLWAVPIGPSGDVSASRDIAIESLPESFSLYAGNQVEIPFSVSARGLAGISFPVQLTWISQDGQKVVAAERDVLPSKALDSVAQSIATTVPSPGSYRLVVEAQSQDGELITSNNQQIAFVDVREGGGRILYIEGQPRLEQTFLRRSLAQFPDLDITYQWIPSDTASSWPVDFAPFLKRGRFDAFILGDLHATALGESQLKLLSDRVAEGAGLVTLGGFHAYERGGYATSPLADVLPIKLDATVPRVSVVGSDTIAANDLNVGQLKDELLIRKAQQHPLTRLGGDDDTATWSSLPPQLGANRFVGPKVAPGVEVLLESPDKNPLLVIGEHGRGRTAAIAFDSTWRWWRAGQSESHRRFWRQLVLWLLNRDTTAEDAIALELDARRFPTTSIPEFRASLPYTQETTPNVSWIVEVLDGTGASKRIDTVSQDGGNRVSGKVAGIAPGLYRLRVSDGTPGSKITAAEMGFQVIDQSRELEQPLADPIYLKQLADVTGSHGGAAFAPDDMKSLIEEIAKRRRRAEVPIVEKLRLGDGPISGWIVFTLFAGAMTTEWILRRKWSLP
jgi:uncharacterized membrane protein